MEREPTGKIKPPFADTGSSTCIAKRKGNAVDQFESFPLIETGRS